MIIWGWGRRTTKNEGQSRTYTCNNCRNVNRFQLLTVKKWFTLFFCPVFPYETSHLEVCPICRAGRRIQKAELQALQQEGLMDQQYIVGAAQTTQPSQQIILQPGPSNQPVDPR